MNWHRFVAILINRNREFIRDRGTLAWNILFPVLIVAGFAFAFSDHQPDQYIVGVQNQDQATSSAFLQTRYIQFIPLDQIEPALEKLQRHQLDMVIDVQSNQYWINDQSPSGYLLEKILHGTSPTVWHKLVVSGAEIRYVDWLIPGVLGMNIMFSALFGVGYVIVRYRKNKVLKRLKATPLTALEFLTAQVVSRLWIILTVSTCIYIGTDFFLAFRMFGHYFDLFVVLLIGAFCLISMGLVVAARLKSEEMAGGLLNLLAIPMMFFSGVWFSLEGLHPYVQQLAKLFPLTHVIDAARAIMLEGATLAAISTQLIILSIMSLVFLLVGALTFRWE